MPPLSLLIKPASGNCNLRCKYCFYHSITETRKIKSYGMMSEETLEVLVEKALKYADKACAFAFQGGEPTLVGLDFFKKLIKFEKKYNEKKLHVNNAIQTNGLAINEEWAKFLAENKFLVGISLDGPKDIHDMHRFDANNKGSFSKVMNAIKLFDKYKVEYNILFVVNSYVARHVNKVYAFFRKNNFDYLQFIPCLDALDEIPGSNNHSLTPERFTDFLKKLFDLWYEEVSQGKMVSIRYFDNLVGMYMGYRPEACGMSGQCNCQFVVEADGSTYPCDFYVLDEYYMGNLVNDEFEDMRNLELVKNFIESSKPVDPKCKDCKWFNLCRGGCRRSREPFINSKPALNYYCESYKQFFAYAGERMYRLAQMYRNR